MGMVIHDPWQNRMACGLDPAVRQDGAWVIPLPQPKDLPLGHQEPPVPNHFFLGVLGNDTSVFKQKVHAGLLFVNSSAGCRPIRAG